MQDVSGIIFGCTLEGPHKVIVLQQPGSTPFHTTLRIIKQDYIESVSECTIPDEDPVEPPIVDERRSREREEKAVRAAELDAAKIGIDVTEEAQAVFDSLAKTLPCKWQNKTIVVLDEVRETLFVCLQSSSGSLFFLKGHLLEREFTTLLTSININSAGAY